MNEALQMKTLTLVGNGLRKDNKKIPTNETSLSWLTMVAYHMSYLEEGLKKFHAFKS